MKISLHRERLTPSEQAAVTAGFAAHSEALNAPDYNKEHFKWLANDDSNSLRGVLTADRLWDWLYVDELWVCDSLRGAGIGRQLMELAEDFARQESVTGLWLWTQSWQAESFYRHLGYEEFTRFENFPKGYQRIGFRKYLSR